MPSHFKEPFNKHSRHQHVKKNVKMMWTGFQPAAKHNFFGRPESSKDFYHIQASNETGLTIGPGCDKNGKHNCLH